MKQQANDLFTRQVHHLEKVYPIGEARKMVFWLFEDILNVSNGKILANAWIEPGREQLEELDHAVFRLLGHEPIQHVLGKVVFYGHAFIVNRHVLIPRQETEELVDLIRKEIKQESPAILDIGTGSGIIPICLKLALPAAEVYGWDVSKEVLETARENAERLGASVHFEKQDILKSIPDERKYDLIVSNPPYVLESEKEEMSPNVLAFDPHLALFVPDNTPLLFYESITAFAGTHLKAGGKLYFEINERFGAEVAALMQVKGFSEVQVIKDLNGKDRMVRGIYE